MRKPLNKRNAKTQEKDQQSYQSASLDSCKGIFLLLKALDKIEVEELLRSQKKTLSPVKSLLNSTKRKPNKKLVKKEESFSNEI